MKQIITAEKLKEIIFMNIGAASMCWSEIPKGIFDSTKAEKLGYEIIEAIILHLEYEANKINL